MARSVAVTEKVRVIEIARWRWLLGTSAGFGVAAVLLYSRLPGTTILHPVKGGLSLLLAAASLSTCLLWLLSDRRLLVAESRLLLVSGRGHRVLGHIPYDEIEGGQFHHGEEGDLFYRPGVAIRLREDRGPDTFWPWLLPGEKEIVLRDRFARSPESLRKLLRRQWQEHHGKKEAADLRAGEIPLDTDMVG